MIDIETIFTHAGKLKKLSGLAALMGMSLIFSPEWILTSFGLMDFYSENKAIVSIITLASLSSLALECVSKVLNSIAATRNEKIELAKTSKESEVELNNKTIIISDLTIKEKLVLLECLNNQDKTIPEETESNLIISLRAYGIIFIPQQFIHDIESLRYVIEPWAWDIINKNRNIIE